MVMRKLLFLLIFSFIVSSCTVNKKAEPVATTYQQSFVWENANMYFLLTDRFVNGDSSNDVNFNRNGETAKLRGFEGGDIAGIIQKIEENYFTDLGINAIWFSPVVEQIHGAVDEGTGATYGFHGYWTKDWTALEPNFGTKQQLKQLVEVAHAKGIRIVLDGVINHTGPVTEADPVWPNTWVRTEPTCNYQNYETTTSCTLVENLPDIKTESETEVELPKILTDKWKAEGRYEQEIQELEAFFKRTGYPRLPKYYIIKWLTDYILEFGVDGYRADTVKHLEADVWDDFAKECHYAFEQWKTNNPDKVLDNSKFYLVGEVYNYGISGGQFFDFGDKKVNYFENGFQSLINFEFKWNAKEMDYEQLFSRYSNILNNELKNYGVLNYVSSHDDGAPFDPERLKPYETANKLLLSPGAAQIYYGDETARSLIIEGTQGDATLRSNMNWDELKNDTEIKNILLHWQKLGKFRSNHPSIGAGVHQQISSKPYYFSRKYSRNEYTDKVIVGLDLKEGEKIISVSSVFEDGTKLKDAYSNTTSIVKDGKISVNTPFTIILLETEN